MSFVLNLTTDELEALRQLERSVDAGRSKVPAPLWAALTTVRGKLRQLRKPDVCHPDGGTCKLRCYGGSEAGTCPCRAPYECPIEDQRGR